MGAVRHRQLIQALAVFVALDMTVGVVALSARRGGRDEVRTTLVAGSVGIPLNEVTGTGVLAGANLKKRRTSNNAAGFPTLETAPTTGLPITSTSSAPVSTATSAPTAPAASPVTVATRPAAPPNPTTGESRAPGASRERGRGLTVQAKPAPETTATTRPGPAGSSSSTTSTTTATARPSTTAPAGGPTTTSQPPAAGQPRSQVIVDDPAGDTFVDGSEKALREPRADIVRAAAAYRSDVIAFAMQVQQPVDPRTDEKWAGDATFAQWAVDTNGDAQADFEIQYYVIDGQLGGAVSKPNSTDVLCGVEATYTAQGYSAMVDPACLGNPASVAFRAVMYYDTNPKDENADVASDVTPNGGMSSPASRPN